MAKEKLFDWYKFLTKKVLKCKIYNVKKVSMSLWADKNISQAERFKMYALFANPWDCPVTLGIGLKVSAKVLWGEKKKAKRLVLPRQWQIKLSAGEIALVTAAGYACFDCKPCTISFEKPRVSKEGKGKYIFRRRGKALGGSLNPLGLLFLPLGFVVISSNTGASVMLQVRKDKMKKQDEAEDLREQELVYQSIWSIAEPNKLNLTSLLEAHDKYADKTETEQRCVEAYSSWVKKHKSEPALDVLRAIDLEESREEASLNIC